MPVSKRKTKSAAKSLKRSIQSVRRTVKKVLSKAFGSKPSAKKISKARPKSAKKPLPARKALQRRVQRRPAALKPRVQILAEPSAETPAPAPAPSSNGWDIPLPQAYHEDRLVLMVRDPWWLYAYWELTPGRRQAAEDEIRRQGSRVDRLVLRVYDVTDCRLPDHHGSFDLCVDFATNWYIDVGKPDRSWIAELGWRTVDGRFVPLVRSNCVQTPRFGISDVLDEEWLLPEDLMRKLYGLSSGLPLGASSIDVREHWERYLKGLVSSDTARRDTAPARKPPHSETIHPTAVAP